MTSRHLSLLGGLALLAFPFALVWGQTGTDPAVQPGVEVLTHGPVHEAFAEPADPDPRAQPIVPKQPPDPVEEMPPDQKPEGQNVQWIPGYFAWDDETSVFLWVSGCWRDVPPGKGWVPGHWEQLEGGWQWSPGFWADLQQTQVQYLPTPPLTLDAGPSVPAPAEDSTYVPGCWVYQQTRYLWRPGFWLAYRPDWVFCPAHYMYTRAGCVFVEGFWDYPLTRRGLLFAPCRFERRVWGTPGWFFRPTYAVPDTALVSSLFVRTSQRRYYFGDYFAPNYTKRGFVPWIDYRLAGRVPDPLFSHTRAFYHRQDPRWEQGLRTLYAERRANTFPRPPRTLVQQNLLVRNLTVNKTVRVTNVNEVVNRVTLAAPLAQLHQHAPAVKLRPVPAAQLAQERKACSCSGR